MIHLAFSAIDIGILAIEVWLAVVTTYLVLLAGASFFFRDRRLVQDGRFRRFAFLVPAHNEEALIGRLLRSIDTVEYPRDRYEVYVVADNCTDETAVMALARGATVYKRFDLTARGKGHALHWLMEQLPLDQFDGLIIVDADSVVSPNLLVVANASLAAGYELGQVYDGVLNRGSSSAAALRALAFDLHNYVRLLGAEVMGASAGIMGNGVLLTPRALQDVGWDAFGLAEDMEAHVKLLRAGLRVHFLPQASVLAEMPDSLSDSSGQNVRWEAGRLDVARRYGFGLILRGVQHGSLPQIAAGIETLVPPQSAQLTLCGLGFALATLTGFGPGERIGLALLLGQAAYVALGLLRLGPRRIPLRALAQAPAYVAWKSLLYLRVLAGQGSRHWVRGGRRPASDRPAT